MQADSVRSVEDQVLLRLHGGPVTVQGGPDLIRSQPAAFNLEHIGSQRLNESIIQLRDLGDVAMEISPVAGPEQGEREAEGLLRVPIRKQQRTYVLTEQGEHRAAKLRVQR